MSRCERSPMDAAYTRVSTLAELQAAIATAATTGRQVRVRGAMHSVCDAILTDPGAVDAVVVYLAGELATVGMHPTDPHVVRVGGGMRLGADPDENVPEEDTLLYWLACRTPAWSVPDLGGISHQSVGGFLSTGSSGGSLRYSFEQAIRGFTFVDGIGQAHEVSNMPGDDLYAALGVSMGLLGVITSVDIEPVPRFAITGQESTSDIDKAAFDLFAPGPGGLEAFLRANDYCRIMWWPQAGVNKLVTWTAQRIPLEKGFIPKPYRELGDSDENPRTYPPELWSTLIPNFVVAAGADWRALLELFVAHRGELPGVMTEFIEQLTEAMVKDGAEGVRKVLEAGTNEEIQEVGVDLYFSLLGNRRSNPLAKRLFEGTFGGEDEWETTWSPLINNGIFLIDDANKVVPGPQDFHDYGDTGLPMDDQISDRLMPTEFTELWIPIEYTVQTMKLLASHYQQGYAATGTYACELYAAKASDFWLSPAFGGDVVRVDLFWFGRNGDSTAPEFYQQFWDLLEANGIPFRPHWGKYLPAPTAPFGPSYYAKVYPQLAGFLELRATLDPKQVFVTDYWRSHLGIAPA
jgi:hypothetical protein